MNEIYHKLNELSKVYAEAEAQRVYLDKFRKCKKAQLMKEAEIKSPKMAVAAQEREAYSHPDYIDLLQGLKVATEAALKARWELDVIKMQFDSWRTKQSTKRAEMQLT